MSSSISRFVTAVALCVPLVAGAVGLGPIEVASGLNEPFDARIRLTGLAPGEVDTLRVALAGDEAFEREGLERRMLLTKLSFEAVASGDRGGYLRVRSREHLREPAFSFIVEVASTGEVVQRRYDVLLGLR